MLKALLFVLILGVSIFVLMSFLKNAKGSNPLQNVIASLRGQGNAGASGQGKKSIAIDPNLKSRFSNLPKSLGGSGSGIPKFGRAPEVFTEM